MSLKNLGFTIIVLLGSLAGPAAARADDPAGGPIVTASAPLYDAATGILRVTATAPIKRDDPALLTRAYAEAENLARLEAVAALTAYVHGLETPSGTIGAQAVQDPRIRGRVDSYVQGASLLGKRYLPGGRIEVDVELNLKGLETILAP